MAVAGKLESVTFNGEEVSGIDDLEVDTSPQDIPVLTGDRRECRKCGSMRKDHDSIGKCPGSRFGYFEAKYNYDGELDHDATDQPICPWCGHIICDAWDYGNEMFSEDGIELECPSCERPFRSSCCTSYSFTTARRDLAAEEADKARRRQDDETRRLERLAACEPFTPGMRVRVDEKAAAYYAGRVGTVENEELDKHNPFVHVRLDAVSGKSACSTFFRRELLVELPCTC